MEAPRESPRRWIRFRLASLLLLMLFASLAALCARWYFTEPTIPLSEALVRFNAFAAEHRVGKDEPPLTEAEVVAAIRSQLATLREGRVANTYSKIARTRRFPSNAEFVSMSGYQPSNGPSRTVWWVNLDIRLSKTSGYGLRVRENNNPGAQPDERSE